MFLCKKHLKKLSNGSSKVGTIRRTALGYRRVSQLFFCIDKRLYRIDRFGKIYKNKLTPVGYSKG